MFGSGNAEMIETIRTRW